MIGWKEAALIATAGIARRILAIRGHKVMIDADLAALYDAPTKRLNQQVKRNAKRSRPISCFNSAVPPS